MRIAILIKILYIFAGLVIIVGIIMLLSNQTASPRFNNRNGGSQVTWNGSQVIFVGVCMSIIGLYIQRKDAQK